MSDDDLEITPELKIVLLGEAAVGKSSILKQYVTHTFDPDINSSISSTITSKEVHITDIKKKIKFNLWDTAGQEKYRSLARIFYKDARVIIFVYSIEDKKSFQSLKDYWYKEVKMNCISNAIFAVIGNKSDLYTRAQVDEKEAIDWADSIGAIFQLTSAKSNSGIDLLFTNIAKKFFDPDYDYKKEDEEAKKMYELKKKEMEENKKKIKEDDNDIKFPKIETIKLDKTEVSIIETNKKGCC
jgi:small GTP-binding protein